MKKPTKKLSKQQIQFHVFLQEWMKNLSGQKSINRASAQAVWIYDVKNKQITNSDKVGNGCSAFNADIEALCNAGLLTAKGYNPNDQYYTVNPSPLYVFNVNAVREEGELADKSTWDSTRNKDVYKGPCATSRTKIGRIVITLCNITRSMNEAELFETVESLAKMQGIEDSTKVAKEYIAGWKQENFIVKL